MTEKTNQNKKSISWKKAFIIALLSLGICILIGVISIFFLSRDLPTLEKLQSFSPNEVSQIISADGEVIDQTGIQVRSIVPKEDIPQSMVNAVIAIEDRRFRNHWGLSLKDLARAIVVDIMSMRAKQGASTISQQLARVLYTKIGYEESIVRKIKELLTAIQIEKMYSKDQIVANYLNSVYLGHVWGIKAASKYYFKKDVKNLDVEECALLAAIINNPGFYSPYKNPRRAFNRRNLVLEWMERENFLTEAESKRYKNTPLQVVKQEQMAEVAPYYVKYVKSKLKDMEDKYNFDIRKDGVKVYTTLNTQMQKSADSVYNKYIRENQKKLEDSFLENPDKIKKTIPDTSSYTFEDIKKIIKEGVIADSLSQPLRRSLTVQGALVAMSPASGKIRAMIGGNDFNLSEFNRATQATRQPGSAFKPIVYATAISNGFSVTEKLLNQPVVLHMSDGSRWAPSNYSGETGGKVTLREGLRHSKNLVAARVIQKLISPSAVVNVTNKMNFSTPVPAVDAIALGSADVKPLDLTAAYGTFANQGVWTKPKAITKIEDRYGNTIYENQTKQNIVFDEESAFLTTSLLQDVINNGTGGRARWLWKFYKPAAGKTGTTNDNIDAWFMGFTPHLVTGVYVGVDNHSISLGQGQTGARAALPIWANFMKAAHNKKGWEGKEFEIPDGIITKEICEDTKKLPNRFCPTEEEYFRKENLPQKYCQKHGEKENEEESSNNIF